MAGKVFGIAMITSNQNSFLPGVLLACLFFVVLWLVFVVLIGLAMMSVGWYDLFRPRWYQSAIITCGAASFAYLLLRTLAWRIAPRTPNCR